MTQNLYGYSRAQIEHAKLELQSDPNRPKYRVTPNPSFEESEAVLYLKENGVIPNAAVIDTETSNSPQPSAQTPNTYASDWVSDYSKQLENQNTLKEAPLKQPQQSPGFQGYPNTTAKHQGPYLVDVVSPAFKPYGYQRRYDENGLYKPVESWTKTPEDGSARAPMLKKSSPSKPQLDTSNLSPLAQFGYNQFVNPATRSWSHQNQPDYISQLRDYEKNRDIHRAGVGKYPMPSVSPLANYMTAYPSLTAKRAAERDNEIAMLEGSSHYQDRQRVAQLKLEKYKEQDEPSLIEKYVELNNDIDVAGKKLSKGITDTAHWATRPHSNYYRSVINSMREPFANYWHKGLIKSENDVHNDMDLIDYYAQPGRLKQAGWVYKNDPELYNRILHQSQLGEQGRQQNLDYYQSLRDDSYNRLSDFRNRTNTTYAVDPEYQRGVMDFAGDMVGESISNVGGWSGALLWGSPVHAEVVSQQYPVFRQRGWGHDRAYAEASSNGTWDFRNVIDNPITDKFSKAYRGLEKLGNFGLKHLDDRTVDALNRYRRDIDPELGRHWNDFASQPKFDWMRTARQKADDMLANTRSSLQSTRFGQVADEVGASVGRGMRDEFASSLVESAVSKTVANNRRQEIGEDVGTFDNSMPDTTKTVVDSALDAVVDDEELVKWFRGYWE